VTNSIPFIDLQAQRRRLGSTLETAIAKAVEGGQWILGPEVGALEERLAAFAGVKHCVTCANGTDALLLILRAWNVGAGDAVFVPAFTFAASAEVVALVGATPVFVDVLEDTFNICPASLKTAIELARKAGLRARVVMPVDLFGQPVDYARIEPIAAREGLLMLCDAAQAFGALFLGRRAGGIGDAAGTSFFPAKPLGCYGDGGACFTNDDALAALLRSIRVHGEGAHKYENVRIGMNSRLDTIQAAILLEKLRIFPQEIVQREAVARRYNERLGRSNRIRVPVVIDGAQSTWAQYTILLPDRDRVQKALRDRGIPTAIYYPIPLSQQQGYRDFPSAPTPVSEKICKTVISLPMHPYLERDVQDRICDAVLEAVGAA
jgi:UDP-2-acetamido-2-deoxy-ribo-hexuluronate aminotransferase